MRLGLSQGQGQDPHVPGEERAAPRIALMMRVGKLVTGKGEFLCLVRDASASGLKVRLFHDLPECDACSIEFGNGDSYPLAKVWERDGHIGFQFARGEIDLGALIDEASPHPRRHLRLRLDRPVTLFGPPEPCAAQLCDLSQHGALVDHAERLPLGLKVQIEGPGLPLLEGRIRWRLGRAHGVVFQRSFRLDELALLSARLQLGERFAA